VIPRQRNGSESVHLFFIPYFLGWLELGNLQHNRRAYVVSFKPFTLNVHYVLGPVGETPQAIPSAHPQHQHPGTRNTCSTRGR
jgi:hypothetical protein